MYPAGNDSEGTVADSAAWAPPQANGGATRGAWRTSSKSLYNGECVTVASQPGSVLVRDSKIQGGVILEFSVRAWRVFTGHLKYGTTVRLARS